MEFVITEAKEKLYLSLGIRFLKNAINSCIKCWPMSDNAEGGRYCRNSMIKNKRVQKIHFRHSFLV